MMYYSWIQWAVAPGVGGLGHAFALQEFSVTPGDNVVAEAWACDNDGNLDIMGTYGCFYLTDSTTSTSVSCTDPGGVPCWSLPAVSGYPFAGFTGEVIVEKNGTNLADYGSVTIGYIAQDYLGNWITFGGTGVTPAAITLVNGHMPPQTLQSVSLDTSGWTAAMTWHQAQ